MKTEKDKQKSNPLFLLLTVMLSVFCILKVFRGSDIENSSAGGFWNYISLFYYLVFLIAMTRKSKYEVRAPFVFAIIYVVLSVSIALINFTDKLNMSTGYKLLMIPYSLMVFMSFYLCSEESKTGEKIILIGFFVCLAWNLRTVFLYRFLGSVRAMPSDIYFSLGLLPFAMQLLQSKKQKTVSICLEFLAVFLIDKRSAMLSFAVGLAVYFLVVAWTKERKKFGTTVKNIFIVAIVLAGFYYGGRYLDNLYEFGIFDRLFRVVEDGGSGRDTIYLRIWEAFKGSRFLEQMFGHGMNTAGRVGGAGQAHSDFFEILYNYGVVAIFAVIGFYISLIKEGIRMIKRNSPYAPAYAYSVIIGLFLSTFSYFLIFYTYVTCIMAFWGYALAMEKKRLALLEGKTK